LEPIEALSPAEISEAIVAWTGWGSSNWPDRDELRLVELFGEDKALNLLPILCRLEEEFFRSDARFTVVNLAEMGDKAAAQFGQLHPELTHDSIEALAWCYSYDHK